MTPKIAVLASGSGSNFQAIIDAVKSGELPAEISGLIVSKPDAGAINRANEVEIPFIVVPPDISVARRSQQSSAPGAHKTENPSELNTFPERLISALDKCKPDLIVLAGFLLKVPDEVIYKYPGRIINIHPSLLPEYGGKGFYGMRVHEAVIRDGRSESGCTVHVVNEAFDEGPILAQSKVPVFPDDTPETLAARVLKEEHKLLPAVIKSLLNELYPN